MIARTRASYVIAHTDDAGFLDVTIGGRQGTQPT
jgi:hypothetical protein